MKKTILRAACLIAFSAIMVSCGTTKNVQSAPDSYSPETENAEGAEGKADGEAAEGESAKSITPRKKKNALEKFFTFGNGDDFIKYDETTVFTQEITGLKEKNATVVLRYDNLMAGFGSYNSAAYYYVQFDKEGRAALAKAAEEYMNDFENKRLQRKGKRTERAYGKIKFRLNWGAISSSTPNYGEGQGFVGYEFVKGSPYFVISNYPFKNEYYERAGDATTRESPSVKYYFTRAQINQLLNMMSEENIAKYVQEYSMDFVTTPSAADEY